MKNSSLALGIRKQPYALNENDCFCVPESRASWFLPFVSSGVSSCFREKPVTSMVGTLLFSFLCQYLNERPKSTAEKKRKKKPVSICHSYYTEKGRAVYHKGVYVHSVPKPQPKEGVNIV